MTSSFSNLLCAKEFGHTSVTWAEIRGWLAGSTRFMKGVALFEILKDSMCQPEELLLPEAFLKMTLANSMRE